MNSGYSLPASGESPVGDDDAYSWVFAGRRFRFEGFAPRDTDQLLHRYPPAPPSDEPCFCGTRLCEVFYRDPKQLGPERPLESSCDYDLRYRPQYVALTGHRYQARIELGPPSRGELFVAAGDTPWLPNVVGNFLNVWLAYDLLGEGGLLLHSSAVVTDTGVLLFIGPSGAGKSTIARLAQDTGLMVLSDDQNALLPGSPYRVRRARMAEDFEHTSNSDYPLRAILRLSHGHRNELHRMSAGEAVAALIAHAPAVNADPFRLEGLTRTATALAYTVPVYRLVFRNEPDLWPWLGDQLR